MEFLLDYSCAITPTRSFIRKENHYAQMIVSNFITLDGFIRGQDKSINSLFDYYHEDYASGRIFDFY